MGPSNSSYLSNIAIVHFHDYGRERVPNYTQSLTDFFQDLASTSGNSTPQTPKVFSGPPHSPPSIHPISSICSNTAIARRQAVSLSLLAPNNVVKLKTSGREAPRYRQLQADMTHSLRWWNCRFFFLFRKGFASTGNSTGSVYGDFYDLISY